MSGICPPFASAGLSICPAAAQLINPSITAMHFGPRFRPILSSSPVLRHFLPSQSTESDTMTEANEPELEDLFLICFSSNSLILLQSLQIRTSWIHFPRL